MNIKKIIEELRNYKKGDEVVSNFDGEVNEKLEELMKKKRIVCGYSAWNFHGDIWYSPSIKKMHCLIMQYGSPIEVIEAKTVEEIRQLASEKYGWD